jgi:hypothetical protein
MQLLKKPYKMWLSKPANKAQKLQPSAAGETSPYKVDAYLTEEVVSKWLGYVVRKE